MTFKEYLEWIHQQKLALPTKTVRLVEMLALIDRENHPSPIIAWCARL
jgi:hypothetical protein